MKNKLCPFCGEEPEILKEVLFSDRCRCSNTKCILRGFHMPLTSWNDRKELLPPMELVEAEKLSLQTEYYNAANEEFEKINTFDAAAFFLEGYSFAINKLKGES